MLQRLNSKDIRFVMRLDSKLGHIKADSALGVTTVYDIVKQSGGYIFVESKIDKGTIFKIYLPQIEELTDL